MKYGIVSLVVPGLGQFLCGRYTRGLLIFGLVGVMVALVGWAVTPPSSFSEATVAFKGQPSNWLWLIVPASLWAWGVWDATAESAARFTWAPTLACLALFYTYGWQASGINLSALASNYGRALQVLRPMFEPDFVQRRAELREG